MKLLGITLPTGRMKMPESPLGQLPPGQQLLIASAVIVLATLAVANSKIVEPLRAQRANLAEQLETANQQRSLMHTLDAATQSLARIKQRLPARTASTAVVQEIASLATAQALTVNTVTPQPPVELGRYARLTIDVDTTGTFANLLRFLQALGTASTPFHLDRIDLEGARSSEGRGGLGGGGTTRPMAMPPGTPADAASTTIPLQLHVTITTLLGES